MRPRWQVVKLIPGGADERVSTHRWHWRAHLRAVRGERNCTALGVRYDVREVTA